MGEYLKRLKELRLAKGISQKEIAEYLGITTAAYSLYERGNREPNLTILKKIAEYYKVSMDDLLEMSDEPQTVAAHLDGDDFTEDEKKEIQQFVEFVKSKRSNNLVIDGSTMVNICNDIAGINHTDVTSTIKNAKQEMSKKSQK